MRQSDWARLLRARIIPIVAALLLGGGITIVLNPIDDNGDGRPDHVRVTVTVPSTAPQGDLAAAAPSGSKATEDPAESDLRDETPAGVPRATIQNGNTASDHLAAAAGVSDAPGPAGGAQNYSVRVDYSGNVFSDFLPGVTPSEFCLHYTVSPNITGWGDILGVQAMFKRTRAASATYIGDFEGHLLQMVPLTKKAWTQGAFNPHCRASIEIIATGTESRGQWLASALFRKKILASLMLDVMRRFHIPVRFVDPVGCTAPPGYTDHNHLECGNDHTDVSPNFPFDVLAAQLRELAQTAAPGRASQLRRRNHVTHAQLRARRCAPLTRTRSPRCVLLWHRDRGIHAAARREHIHL